MEKNINQMIEYPSQGILSKELVKTEKFTSDLFCMTKGTNISEHTSTKQGSVQVLEGDGIFNLEGKDIKMEKGVFIFMNENAKHSLKANKNTAFILTLVK
jgi:quercetin dioxygenase-like cupin family protein